MNSKEARNIIGNLSYTTKMPCPSYSLPAQNCQVGSKLVNIKGSVCHNCYALKGMYRFKQGKVARDKRLASIYNPKWVEAITTLLHARRKNKNVFRWHDSGDIQSIMHMCNIMEVARRTPDVKHWIPTREYGYVKDYVESGKVIPSNVFIRVSALMVNGSPPSGFAKRLNKYKNVEGFIGTSTVGNSPTCPAYTQGGKCNDCRVCWTRKDNVEYPLH